MFIWATLTLGDRKIGHPFPNVPQDCCRIAFMFEKISRFQKKILKMADFLVVNLMKNRIFATNAVQLWHTIVL